MSTDTSNSSTQSTQSETEVHMSSESTSSSGSTSSGSTQSNGQEAEMNTDGSTTSSTGGSTQDGESNGSTSTKEASGSPPDQAKQDGGEEKKPRKITAPYLSDTETDAAEKAIAANLTHPDPAVQAAVARTRACRQDVLAKRRDVQACSTEANEVRKARASAVANLKVGLLGAMWTTRAQPDGHKFAKGLEGNTDVQTAENILSMVPGSRYSVPAEIMTLIATWVGPVRAAELKLATYADRMKVVGPAYSRSVAALRAATIVLNTAVRSAKYAALIPAAPVDVAVKGSVRAPKSRAARTKRKG